MADLEAIRQRLAMATPGGWAFGSGSRQHPDWVFANGVPLFQVMGIAPKANEPDRTLVVNAPSDIADLLRLVDRYRDVIVALEAELAFWRDEDPHPSQVVDA